MSVYLTYSGIQGTVQHVAGLPGQWIQLDSFQWGVGRGISGPTAGASDKEGSNNGVSEIVVTKPTDSSSADLFLKCLAGEKLTVSVVVKNSGSESLYHTISLTNATISSFKTYIPPIHKGKSTKYEKLTLTFSEYLFNGAENVPIPHSLMVP
jgi:type VI secretion system secreted protein Hcp